MAKALLLGLFGLSFLPASGSFAGESRPGAYRRRRTLSPMVDEDARKRSDATAGGGVRQLEVTLEEGKPEAGGVFRSHRAEEAAAKAAAEKAAADDKAAASKAAAEKPAPAKAAEEKPAAEAPKAASDAGAGKPARTEPMTLADAKLNFETVVRTHLADQDPPGLLEFEDPAAGRTRRLSFVSLKRETLQELGEGRYSALAVLREAKAKAPVELEITVDLSGERWAVAEVRRPGPKPGKKAAPSSP